MKKIVLTFGIVCIGLLLMSSIVEGTGKISECSKTKGEWKVEPHYAEEIGKPMGLDADDHPTFKCGKGQGKGIDVEDGKHMNIRVYQNEGEVKNMNFHIFMDKAGKFVSCSKLGDAVPIAAMISPLF